MRSPKLPFLLFIPILLASLVSYATPAGPDLHPIVCGGYLLGGSERGAWKKPAEVEPVIRGGERYKLYTLSGCAGEGLGGPLKYSDPCGTEEIEVKPAAGVKGDQGDCVALRADWQAMPRVPALLSVESRAYREAVVEILKANGLPGAPVEIGRIVRLDLEGDGTDEVLIQAGHMPGGTAVLKRKNTYSFILLRRLRGSRVESILLESGFHLKDGKIEDGRPITYTLGALADLNGDGVMDILTRYRYFEGVGYTVHDGAAARAVLENGCGL